MNEAAITSANIIESHGSDDLVWLLQNWARWAKWGDDGAPQVPTKCASAERGYEIPIWKEEEAPPAPPDELAGERVELAIANLQDLALRRVLRVHFVLLPDWWMRLLATQNGEDFSMAIADQRRAKMMEWPTDRYLMLLGFALRAVARGLGSVKAAA